MVKEGKIKKEILKCSKIEAFFSTYLPEIIGGAIYGIGIPAFYYFANGGSDGKDHFGPGPGLLISALLSVIGGFGGHLFSAKGQVFADPALSDWRQKAKGWAIYQGDNIPKISAPVDAPKSSEYYDCVNFHARNIAENMFSSLV